MAASWRERGDTKREETAKGTQMKGETFRQSAKHKCQPTRQAGTTHLITFKGRARDGDGDGDGKGSRWEIFHNTEFRAQRLGRTENWDGEQAICQSKQKSGGPAIRTREMKLKKPEKRRLKYEWFLGLQRWLCEAHAHPQSGCQKQQTGLEKYWRQSVPALTLNKAISTSLKHGCPTSRQRGEERCSEHGHLWFWCRTFFFG